MGNWDGWTEEYLKSKGYTESSDGVFSSRDSGKVPDTKSSVRERPEKPDEAEKTSEATRESRYRFAIIVTEYRHRHVDPDNLCPKWYIDELVRAGVLPDDSSRFVLSIAKRLRKVPTSDQERTQIQIIRYG